ncbi:uncharacterized protein B0H18DRAFT_1023903 [Fomitopsis serialis]|uniref:uncharacterized protein n=1 Tax=Fomitopsis serialis TaxID=139415 RepID=UPI00200831AA|nr:uncharacterized protein B0H18DRAFT_1023903 [Neoantrodia serialis]KAH9920435.1 hypothetical protein B0H18DRAFT_1023903 [Neoantrodia serialis]
MSPDHKPQPSKRRQLDELYARDLMARGREGRSSNKTPWKPPRDPSPHPKKGRIPKQPFPSQAPRNPNGHKIPSIVVTKHRRGVDEHLLARATEEDELFARAWEDVVFARTDVDDLD